MQITVNGKPRAIATACTLLELLQQHDLNPLVVAIEYNGDIIRRERFGEITIQDGDTVEIVHMVGGGSR